MAITPKSHLPARDDSKMKMSLLYFIEQAYRDVGRGQLEMTGHIVISRMRQRSEREPEIRFGVFGCGDICHASPELLQKRSCFFRSLPHQLGEFPRVVFGIVIVELEIAKNAGNA